MNFFEQVRKRQRLVLASLSFLLQICQLEGRLEKGEGGLRLRGGELQIRFEKGGIGTQLCRTCGRAGHNSRTCLSRSHHRNAEYYLSSRSSEEADQEEDMHSRTHPVTGRVCSMCSSLDVTHGQADAEGHWCRFFCRICTVENPLSESLRTKCLLCRKSASFGSVQLGRKGAVHCKRHRYADEMRALTC